MQCDLYAAGRRSKYRRLLSTVDSISTLFTDEQLQKFKEGKEYGYQTVNW